MNLTIAHPPLARTGRLMNVSSAATFFFGAWYLQHVINRASETPARIEGGKKRRKKKERAPETTDAG